MSAIALVSKSYHYGESTTDTVAEYLISRLGSRFLWTCREVTEGIEKVTAGVAATQLEAIFESQL